MPKFIKCPRCDLNWIKEGEEYCDVCKAELKKGPQLMFAIDEEDDMEEELTLCPICHHNYIKPGEKMCSKCADEMDYKKDQVDLDKDEEWKNFLDEDEDEDKEEESEEMMSLCKLAEEEGSELFDDEEDEEEIEMVESEDPDDFEIPEIDERDFEEDEEDEEDYEDEEDEDF